MRKIALDTFSNVSFAEQLSTALRRQIANGTYKAGDTLPSLQELARQADVSLNVVRRSLALLKFEGLVMPRPHIGTVVLKASERTFRGRVLFIVPEGNTAFYMATLIAHTQKHLLKAGFETVQILLPVSEKRAISVEPLRHLPVRHYDLALSIDDETHSISQELKRLRIPFVTLGGRPSCSVGSKGLVFLQTKAGAQGFLKDCARKHPRDILELVKENSITEPHAVEGLKALGIPCQRLVAPKIFLGHVPETAETSALRAMNDFLDKKNPLPEVLFLTDDYMARGAITALLSHGIRIPKDLKVVTFSVKGHGPVLNVPLTRIEADPFADAATLAKGLLAVLAGKPLPRTCILKTVYKTGKTF